jgi:Phosphotransferase enzyme family
VTEEPSEKRSITIVVLDADGNLGELGPFVAATPWWPDTLPIGEVYPGLAVLRLLSATPAPGARIGGDVTYLAEPLSGELAPKRRALGTTPWPGTLHDDVLRLPWATPGGPADDLAWACSHLERAGAPTQYRTWNLSAIWTIPTTRGDAWLKCVPPFSQHESVVLDFLADLPGVAVPRLIASSGHRQLLASMPGDNGYRATLAQRRVLVDELVSIQRSTVQRTGELLDRGVPDRRWPALLQAAANVVDRQCPRDPRLHQLLVSADARIAAIDACGLPDVLLHGDAHGGNARIGSGTGNGIWFDWADARIGHPLLDVAVLERPRTLHRAVLLEHWLGAWRAAIPGSDPWRAWELVRPLAALGDAVVYQGFVDQIEESERIYHLEDVPMCLERAAELAAAR